MRELLVELGGRYARRRRLHRGRGGKDAARFGGRKNAKAGALINGARVALTGQAVAPSLFAVMVALGKERTVNACAA